MQAAYFSTTHSDIASTALPGLKTHSGTEVLNIERLTLTILVAMPVTIHLPQPTGETNEREGCNFFSTWLL